ncbi:MAG: endonuclease [Candidatus Izemoplasmatales bacterium]
MKKIKLLVFTLIALFMLSNIKVNAETNPQDSLVNITVKTYFDSTNIITNPLDPIAYGSRVSFASELSSLEGYSFVFWMVNDIIYPDFQLTDNFTANGNSTITAVFKPNDKVAAIFLDSNGKLLEVQYVTPGDSAIEISELKLPSKPGYMISSTKWNHSLSNLTVDTIFILQYEKVDNSSYTVSVTNGTGGGSYEFNTQATVVASDAAAGEYFNYWKSGDRIVSLSPSYTFTVLQDIAVEAVYSTSSYQDQPFVSLSPKLGIRVGYLSYLGQFYLPEGYTLIEHGMVVSTSSGIINLGSSSITKYQSNTFVATTNEYLMSFSNTSIQSVRAYIIVEDVNGNYMTIYNEVLTSASTPSIADDLFFSFYMEGSSYNKVVSIYNGTGSSVNLSEYSVQLYSNGAASASQSMTLNGTLANGDVYVISHSSAIPEILAIADATSSAVINFSGDDAVTLTHNSTIIDTIGQVGVDPGSAWGTGDITTLDHSLVRLSSTTSGDTVYNDAYSPADYWVGYAKDTYLGYIDTFTMDGSGSSKSVTGFDAFINTMTYNALSTLSLSNSYLKVYYDDGSSSIETITSDMVSNFSTSVSGDYTLTVTYGSFTDTLDYHVQKINPSYTIPTFSDTELTSGLSLNNITLPSNFSWENPSASLSLGTHTFTVTYTPSNTDAYNTITGIEVSINFVEVVTPIIIYEVYGGGGNVSATYNQDYVILYNNTSSSIDLSTYSLQYASTSTYTVFNLSGTIMSHNYFVIGLLKGSVGEDLDVAPNVSFGTSIVVTAGRIALVDDQNQITDKTDANVVDFVGYGSASEYETSPTATTSASLSAKRISFSDTNDNSADFTVGTPNLSYVASSLTVTGFSVHNLKAYYEVSEALSVTNAYLIVSYSNGSTSQVDVTSDMISSFSSSTLGDYSMNVTYSGITESYAYHVIDYSSLGEVEIYYIDIGIDGGPAGEAALIKIGGIDILIDSGDDDSSAHTSLLNFLSTHVTDGVIEYIIATHPHADHIGGFVDVMDNYVVQNVIEYSTSTDYVSALRAEYEDRIVTEGSTVYDVYTMVTNSENIINIISGVSLTFYNTGYLTSADPNNSSIVFVLNAFDTLALFNGDAEGDQEAVYAPLVGDLDILKLGHHGSAAGTTSFLLTETTPNAIVVNDGNYLGNSYGHPTYTALSHIYNYSDNVPVYSVTGGNGASSDIMLDRNGTLTVTISSGGYVVTSEYYGYNPMELSNTAYWSTINTSNIDGYYYAAATGETTASVLKAYLHNIIKGHHSVGYSQVDENLGITDEDPNNANNVILFYTGRSQAKSTFGSLVDQWNREHIWANSHGIDDQEPAYSDLHHLRPTDVSVNSIRGNLDFSTVEHISANLVSDTYGDSIITRNYEDGVYFEPRDEIKGDVARMLLYMTVRYEGDVSGEPDLELVNGVTTTTSNNLGDLATLLQWCIDDPVDDTERLRNEAIFGIQNNRNPFIDHPELIYILYSSELGV